MFVFQYLSDFKSGNPIYLTGNENLNLVIPAEAGIQKGLDAGSSPA